MANQEECMRCGGSGYLTCDKCRGEGKVKIAPPPSAVEFDPYYGTCDKCGGGGKSRCPTCKGTGVVTISRD